MATRKRSKVWLYFTKIDTQQARCNICNATRKASLANTSNYWKHLGKHNIYISAEECQVFDSLRNGASGTAATSPSRASVEDDGSETSSTSSSELPQQPISEEHEGLVDPKRSFSPVLEGPEPPRIKEEPEEPCSIQEGEQLVLKEETETFMLTPTYKDSKHSDPQLKHGHMPFSYNSHIAENQSLEGSKHEDSESNRNKEPNIIPQSSHNTDLSGIHFGPLQDQQSYKCDSCDEAFRSKSALRTHHRVHTGKETHSCKICGETFGWKSNLVLHTRRHKDDRPFSCKLCGHRFFNMAVLRKHSLIHTDERPFKCDTCDKSCRSKSDLNVHMRTHTGERPYSCGICGKNFSQISHYYSHIKIHTGEKPFSCKTCGKRFHQVSHLKSHVWTHENRFMCKTCGHSCRDSHELKSHMRVHTGERP